MKGYLLHHTRGSFSLGTGYYPSGYHVCIAGKIHLHYWKHDDKTDDKTLAGRSNIDEFVSNSFSPCDGSCVSVFFRDKSFLSRHPPPYAVLEFLQSIMASDAAQEIPARLVPFVERVLAGEDATAVTREILRLQENYDGLLPK